MAAHKMIEKIFTKVEDLSKFPERGRVVPEANRNEIREVFEAEYRILYRIDSKRIYILSLRNFKELLKNKDIK
jgi:plasmid stabilization system protein ParE